MDINYDLKLEIVKNEKATECIQDILNKINFERSIEEIFNNKEEEPKYIERYLLFKAQGALGCNFDCDKTEIVKTFFEEKFHYKEDYFDTLISMQYIWGMMLRILWKKDELQKIPKAQYEEWKEKYGFYIDKNTKKPVDRIKNAQKFIYELSHLEEIKETLGENLYRKFEELAHIYHTIGNMSPCPQSPFNQEKGFEEGCYDRLDLFMTTEKYEQNKEWQEWFEKNRDSYYLEKFIENDLGIEIWKIKKSILIEKEKGIIDKKKIEQLKQECEKYINKILQIIEERGKCLISKDYLK